MNNTEKLLCKLLNETGYLHNDTEIVTLVKIDTDGTLHINGEYSFFNVEL